MDIKFVYFLAMIKKRFYENYCVHLLVAFGHTSRSGIARILNIISTKFKVLRVSKTPIFNLEIRITKILPCVISVKLKRGNICKGLLLLIICFKMPNEAQM